MSIPAQVAPILLALLRYHRLKPVTERHIIPFSNKALVCRTYGDIKIWRPFSLLSEYLFYFSTNFVSFVTSNRTLKTIFKSIWFSVIVKYHVAKTEQTIQELSSTLERHRFNLRIEINRNVVSYLHYCPYYMRNVTTDSRVDSDAVSMRKR